jgi:hypothetical protein
VQVGKVDLTGRASMGGSMTINMPATIFFAYSTGEAPRIWIAGNVNGTYTGRPAPSWNFKQLFNITTIIHPYFND